MPPKPNPPKLDVKMYVIIVIVIVAGLVVAAVILALHQNKKDSNQNSNFGIGSSAGSSDNSDLNSKRRADVNTILNAVYQYSIDNQGSLPAGVTSTPTDICVTDDSNVAFNCAGLVNLSVLTDNGTYLTAIPKDPSSSSANDSHYQISADSSGKITVSAPEAEGGQSIYATR